MVSLRLLSQISPWMGCFEMASRVDQFVMLDDVNLVRMIGSIEIRYTAITNLIGSG